LLFSFKFYRQIILAVSFVSLMMLVSCKNFTTSEISEGIIEYDISYPFPEQITLSVDLMPKTLVYKFNEGFTHSSISAGMGALNTYVITDIDKQEIVQGLSILGKKYKIVYNREKIDSILNAEQLLGIEETGDTKVIAGYNCKKVICHFKDSILGKAEVYYTNEIKQKDANWYSIYNKIDGVLMEFYLKRYNIQMRMTAKNVQKEDVVPAQHKLGEEYKLISQQEMDSYFNM
jgi:hypothetical protein